MANIINTSNDANTIGALAGVNVNRVNNTFLKQQFKWIEPKDDLASKIFPSPSTYHPLADYTKKDLVNYMLNIQSADIQQLEKDMYTSKIQAIVEELPYRKAMSNVYIACIIFAIVVLLGIYNGTTYTSILKIVGVIGALLFAYAWFIAKGKGINDWSDFSNDLSSRQQAGATLDAIMKQYAAEEENDKNRQAMMQMGQQNNQSGNAMAGFAGAAFGSMFNKK
ncbi:hypothetical protein EBS67_16185 [bacterium]|nr:hypothetical protein [bacterium]